MAQASCPYHLEQVPPPVSLSLAAVAAARPTAAHMLLLVHFLIYLLRMDCPILISWTSPFPI